MKLPKEEEEEGKDDKTDLGNGSSTRHPHPHPTNSAGPPSLQPQHEAAMYGAIDAFCDSSEQTYDQFMTTFTHLKPGDVLQSGGRVSIITQDDRVMSPSTSSMTTPSGSYQSLPAEPGTDIEEEGLCEEMLDEGTVVPSMLMRQSSSSSGKLVKFDNFVEDKEAELGSSCDECSSNHDSSDEEEIYLPSFGGSEDPALPISGNTSSLQAKSFTSPDVHKDLDPDVTDEVIFPSAPTMVESNVGSISSEIDGLTPPPPHQQQPAAGQVMDSTGEWVCVDDNTRETNTENYSDGELVYDQTFDRPNPGEVESERECASGATLCEDDVTNIREMEYSAKVGDVEEHIRKVAMEMQGCTEKCKGDDAVQPFSLDEGFDYDNVILTPKYSANEMEQIMNGFKSGPVYADVPEDDTNIK